MIELPLLTKEDEKWFQEAIQNYNPVYPPNALDVMGRIIKSVFYNDFNIYSGADAFKKFTVIPFEKLCEYKNAMDDTTKPESLRWNSIKNHPDCNLFISFYKTFVDKKNNLELVKRYGIKCCPYCNENYIFNRRYKAGCQLDHFIPKDKYPIFAVCLYNLNPVCSVCNHIKGTKDTYISAQDHAIKDERRKFHISYKPKTADFMCDSEEFDVDFVFDSGVNADFENNMKKDIKILQLDSAYEHHKDVVLELLKKARVYKDITRLEMLLNSFDGLFDDESEILRLIFANYIDEEDLLKRPLSKLTRDLLLELEVISDD